MKDNQAIVYCQGSNTFRLMPENYLLAAHNGLFWEPVPDLAAPLDVVLLVTAALHKHEMKYTQKPLEILAEITGDDVREAVNSPEMQECCKMLNDLMK